MQITSPKSLSVSQLTEQKETRLSFRVLRTIIAFEILLRQGQILQESHDTERQIPLFVCGLFH